MHLQISVPFDLVRPEGRKVVRQVLDVLDDLAAFDVSVVPIQSTAEDAQLTEIRAAQVEEIGRVFGVPRPLLGVHKAKVPPPPLDVAAFQNRLAEAPVDVSSGPSSASSAFSAASRGGFRRAAASTSASSVHLRFARNSGNVGPNAGLCRTGARHISVDKDALNPDPLRPRASSARRATRWGIPALFLPRSSLSSLCEEICVRLQVLALHLLVMRSVSLLPFSSLFFFLLISLLTVDLAELVEPRGDGQVVRITPLGWRTARVALPRVLADLAEGDPRRVAAARYATLHEQVGSIPARGLEGGGGRRVSDGGAAWRVDLAAELRAMQCCLDGSARAPIPLRAAVDAVCLQG